MPARSKIQQYQKVLIHHGVYPPYVPFSMASLRGHTRFACGLSLSAPGWHDSGSHLTRASRFEPRPYSGSKFPCFLGLLPKGHLDISVRLSIFPMLLMKFRLIEDQRETFPVRIVYDVMGVSPGSMLGVAGPKTRVRRPIAPCWARSGALAAYRGQYLCGRDGTRRRCIEGRWKMMILAHPFGETVMRFSARRSKSAAEDADPAVAQSRKGRCHHPHCSPTGSAEGRIHADRLMTAFSGLPRPGLTRFSQRGMMGCEHRSRPLFGTPGAVKS